MVYTFQPLLFTSDSCLDLNHFKSHLRDIRFPDIYLSTISLNYNCPLDIIPSTSNRQVSYKHLLVHIRTLELALNYRKTFLLLLQVTLFQTILHPTSRVLLQKPNSDNFSCFLEPVACVLSHYIKSKLIGFLSTASYALVPGTPPTAQHYHSNYPSFPFIFFLNLFYLFVYLLFIFGCVGSSFLYKGFLQLRQTGATLHCGVRASHYRGLSCCGAQAPDAQAQ